MAGPSDTHEWMSFSDPEEDRTWLFDVTFLTSPWRCVYGAGCEGVLTGPAASRSEGCCSYGAHFADDQDVRRVEAAAATLTAEQWQHRSRGRSRGPIARRSGGAMTRLVDGACIFLNRPGFPGGPGCALHRAALERSESPMVMKPDVCWQLPLRRQDATDEATGHVTSTVTEWDRRHWGPAGEEFHWWCTEAPEAFTGARPVYRSLAEELVGLVGLGPYEALVGYLEERAVRGTALPHPVVRRHSRSDA
ncbi:MAG TPA: hypothetical protein VND23_07240 [Acidimicrobiales bacterium]|nr:hypothetical protein [Acidimicrobiales bacterium]